MTDSERAEFHKVVDKIISVDFDGVIHHYIRSTWNPDHVDGLPVEGTAAAVIKLKYRGWKIIVFTARYKLVPVVKWLEANHIPFDDVTNIKPTAAIYLDDRGLKFNGDWEKTLSDIGSFMTWLGY